MSRTVALRIEMDRGRGWELRSEGRIPADTDTARIEQDLRAYAVQHPHRAIVDGVEVARVGAITTVITLSGIRRGGLADNQKVSGFETLSDADVERIATAVVAKLCAIPAENAVLRERVHLLTIEVEALRAITRARESK